MNVRGVVLGLAMLVGLAEVVGSVEVMSINHTLVHQIADRFSPERAEAEKDIGTGFGIGLLSMATVFFGYALTRKYPYSSE